jgi:hypothetical protein
VPNASEVKAPVAEKSSLFTGMLAKKPDTKEQSSTEKTNINSLFGASTARPETSSLFGDKKS